MGKQKEQVISDLKERFRQTSIEEEGNDPAKDKQVEPDEEEEGNPWESTGEPVGRPPEGTKYNTQYHVRGADPLGNKTLSRDYRNRDRSIVHTTRESVDSIKKSMDKNKKTSLLSENNLIDEQSLRSK